MLNFCDVCGGKVTPGLAAATAFFVLRCASAAAAAAAAATAAVAAVLCHQNSLSNPTFRFPLMAARLGLLPP